MPKNETSKREYLPPDSDLFKASSHVQSASTGRVEYKPKKNPKRYDPKLQKFVRKPEAK